MLQISQVDSNVEVWYSEHLRAMNSWIAVVFECGHTLQEIYNMDYNEYVTIVSSMSEKRNSKQGRNLRPVQKSAIRKRQKN